MCDTGPDAPDPVATAKAQGDANKDAAFTTTALNRANQVTPLGNLTWSNDPTNPTSWTSTIELSPEQKKLMDTQTQLSLGLADSQNASLGRVQNTLATGVDTTQLPNRASSQDIAGAMIDAGKYGKSSADFSAGNRQLLSTDNLYKPLINFTEAGAATTDAARGNFGRQLSSAMPTASAPELLGSYSAPTTAIPGYSTPAGSVPTFQRLAGQAPDSNEAYRGQIMDSLYQLRQSRLDPRFSQAQQNLDTQLAVQGITQGSEAYRREQERLSFERNDAYNQAMNEAIAGGEAAIQGQYGRDLAGRQQNVSENQQGFGNDLATRQQVVGEASTAFDNNLKAADLDTARAKQAWDAEVAQTTANNAARNEQFAQALAGRQQTGSEYALAHQLTSDDAGKLLSAGQLGATNAGAELDAEKVKAATDLAGQQLQVNILQNNPALAQQMANLSAGERERVLSEMLRLRALPLNELNALRSGAQMQSPNFTSTPSGANVTAAPVADSIWNAYNGEVAQQASLLNGLTSLGGAYLLGGK